MSDILGSPDAGELYGSGARDLQDHFDARRLADRLSSITVTDELDPRQQAFIERASYFFLATTDADGFPDVSHKGGRPGFVQVVDGRTLRFPSYDGNGMYRSLGNIVDTGKVALLFIRQDDRPVRIRIHGTASVVTDPDVVASFEGAEAVVEVRVGRSFPNCPRYIHDQSTGELSDASPGDGHTPRQPDWKTWDTFKDVLPAAEHRPGSGLPRPGA
jgi:predicted pyridoxine 5'-phosphate oxidase superfamily flavin-nucleotide-binding protein